MYMYIRVKFEEYVNDNARHEYTKRFDNLSMLEEYLFQKAFGPYDKSISFINPDRVTSSMIHMDKELWLPPSSISVTTFNGSTLMVHLIEKTPCSGVKKFDSIIYSTGVYTNGICYWNDEVKDWLRHCNQRKENPQFNFAP